jgi:putative transcriptional regulator
MAKGLRRKGPFALAAMLAALALAAVVPVRADEELGQGKILVADRKLKDPHFAQTVVLIVGSGDQGTLGLVLNRESEVLVTELLKGVKEARGRDDTAFEGGPVEPMSVVALLRSPNGPRGAEHVSGDIWAILDPDAIKDALAAHVGPDQLRFFVGYTGWAPGQLETEVDAGAWRIVRGGADTVFDNKPKSLWERLVRNLDVTYAMAIRPRRP